MLSENHIQALAEIERHLLEEHPVLSVLARRFEPHHGSDARPFPVARLLIVVGLLLMVAAAVLALPVAAMAAAALSLCGLGVHLGCDRVRQRRLHHRRLRHRRLGGHDVLARSRPAPAHGPRRRGPV